MSSAYSGTIPAGWKQFPWVYENSTNNFTVSLNTPSIYLDLDTSNFRKNILSAWTDTSKGLIDDVIGYSKVRMSYNGGARETSFTP